LEEITERIAMERNVTERKAEAISPRIKILAYVELKSSELVIWSSMNFFNSTDNAKPAPMPAARSKLVTCM